MTHDDMASYESRRVEVDTLLRAGSDKKILYNSTAEALKKIRLAYQKACEEPQLPEPWISVAGYRLAHLIMRCEPTTESLREAKELYEKASRQETLGSLPHIYTLSVLSRLR
ncbi:MAG: hypothetical protein RRA35_14345, partial [Desulfomonilia bacterium]|nr:hypothetical protein [Desulfomonilia bacterium]